MKGRKLKGRVSDAKIIKWVLEERDRVCLWGMYSGDPCRTTALHVHHIQKRSQFGPDEPDNLITLCAWHHDMAERHSIEPEELKSALESFLVYQESNYEKKSIHQEAI